MLATISSEPSRAYLKGVKVPSPWWERLSSRNGGLSAGLGMGGLWKSLVLAFGPRSPLPPEAPHPLPPRGRLPVFVPFSLVLWIICREAGTAGPGRPGILCSKPLGDSQANQPRPSVPFPGTCHHPTTGKTGPGAGLKEGRGVTPHLHPPAHLPVLLPLGRWPPPSQDGGSQAARGGQWGGVGLGATR